MSKSIRIITLIFAILLCFSILTGCEDIATGAGAKSAVNVDFRVADYGWFYTVYYDTETRVMYLRIDDGGGITPLYNADGSLRLYHE